MLNFSPSLVYSNSFPMQSPSLFATQFSSLLGILLDVDFFCLLLHSTLLLMWSQSMLNFQMRSFLLHVDLSSNELWTVFTWSPSLLYYSSSWRNLRLHTVSFSNHTLTWSTWFSLPYGLDRSDPRHSAGCSFLCVRSSSPCFSIPALGSLPDKTVVLLIDWCWVLYVRISKYARDLQTSMHLRASNAMRLNPNLPSRRHYLASSTLC